MKDFFLRIYDFLTVRKWLAWTALSLLLVLCGLLVTRMDFEEDISAFLPSDAMGDRYRDVYASLGGQDRVAVIFDIRDLGEDAGDTPPAPGDAPAGTDPSDREDLLLDAMDDFCGRWPSAQTLDESAALDVFGFISSAWPYFLEDADYARMDSLLAVKGYLKDKLAADKSALNLPGSALTSGYMRTDPLGLFTPVLGRLRNLNPTDGANVREGHLFTPDGATGVVFFTSPYGDNESGRNAGMLDSLSHVTAAVEEANPGVSISVTGGPAVAVENASRIKKDSILALGIALVLICIVLFLSYRRFGDVFWIAVSIVCGAAFSLGLVALFKSTLSIIVLGIGAMILGVAVNYPLHYIDHMKYAPDKRRALKEQVTPLLVGNITTVGAFLSLVLVKSRALHDFGLVGALMLVGTIVFVLVFLPVLAPARKDVAENTLRLDFDRHIHPGRTFRRLFFALFVIVTVVLGILGRGISFDSDMHHINYMTPAQSRGFEILSTLGEGSGTLVYAVAEGDDAEQALERAGEWGCINLASFLPSRREQALRLERWNGFVRAHADLPSLLRSEASRQGFSDSAFVPFLDMWNREYAVQDASFFSEISAAVGPSVSLDPEDGRPRIVGFVRTTSEDAASVKANLASSAPEGCFCFDSTDVSSRLVSLLSEDFDNIGLICGLIVFLFLWASFRRLELSIMSFLPLALGWVWILGIMNVAGLQFNIVNIILATFIFGMGDDYTIFITEGLMYEYACGRKILHSFKNSVTLSALIMFIGIGVLVFARHPAMRSVGAVTVIGMFVVVAMALYLPPVVFRALTSRGGVLRDVPVTLGRLWNSFLAMMFFLCATAVLVPGVFIYFAIFGKGEKRRLGYHRFLQRLSRFIIHHVPGCSFEWRNVSGENFEKPAVVVCNHQSHLDVMALMMLSPKIVIITNDWVWNNPFYGFLIKKAEFYPASDGVEANTERIRDLVRRGYSVVMFPEGTRSVDCSIGRFHRGPIELARELGVDILPVFIHGFGYVLPKKDFMLRRGAMYMEVRARISPGVPGGEGGPKPAETSVPGVSVSGGGVVQNECPMSGGVQLPEDIREATRWLRAMYVREYSRIRRERETAALCAQYVRYQYIYKGTEAASECRRTLRPDTFRKVDSLPAPEDGMVVVSNAGYGVYALLLALSRPELSVVAYEADEEKFLVASHCSAVPSNLHYVFGEGPSEE